MRKTYILGLGILSFLLFSIPARYIYVCKIKNNCVQTNPVGKTDTIPSLGLMLGDTALLGGYDHFYFEKDSISSDLTLNNKRFLDKIVDYLNENSDQNLTITGLFRNSEYGVASGIFENLGLARANFIRNYLIQRQIDIDRVLLDHAQTTDDDFRESLFFNLFIPQPEGDEGESTDN